MDLLEYVALQMKKGKNPAEIRQLLVQNGYPVYEVENALSVADTKEEETKKGIHLPKISGISLPKMSLNVHAPGYVVILVLSGILMLAGIVTLILYFV